MRSVPKCSEEHQQCAITFTIHPQLSLSHAHLNIYIYKYINIHNICIRSTCTWLLVTDPKTHTTLKNIFASSLYNLGLQRLVRNMILWNITMAQSRAPRALISIKLLSGVSNFHWFREECLCNSDIVHVKYHMTFG